MPGGLNIPNTVTHQPSQPVQPSSSEAPISSIHPMQPPLTPHINFATWAPVWLYSALGWVGKSYYDASAVQRTFSFGLCGSDVDPYVSLGSTLLFFISQAGNGGWAVTFGADMLSIQQGGMALNSNVPTFANTDAGILAMYRFLVGSPVFSKLKYCYIPSHIGNDIVPGFVLDTLSPGYDPDTGIRVLESGNAVSQLVPLAQFTSAGNEQVYNESPTIVPLSTALVYDVTQHNVVGARVFTLPTYYARDQVSPGVYCINKFGSPRQVFGLPTVQCGQTVTFPGGPGYVDATAVSLNAQGGSGRPIPDSGNPGLTWTTYSYDTATVVTTSTLGPKVQLGVVALACSSFLPSEAFSQQQIIGYYQKKEWATSLGLPIFDFGMANGSFSATLQDPADPTLVYDPAHPFLNGGSIQNVLSTLAHASYLFGERLLISLLRDGSTNAGHNSGAGLGVATAALDFHLSSLPTVSGPPPLQIADSSLFIYVNINVDDDSVGSVSPSNVFLASVAINISPDNRTSAAFSPCPLLMGVVRQAPVGRGNKYVFIPGGDSIALGDKRYMVGVINIVELDTDPDSRPFPPKQWGQHRFWQFANRHNPYLDAQYAGDTQLSRIEQAQRDAARIGLQAAHENEPMQMYLDANQYPDANQSAMKVLPIYGLPFNSVTQVVDGARLRALVNAVQVLADSPPPKAAAFSPGPLDAEEITVPSTLQQPNLESGFSDTVYGYCVYNPTSGEAYIVELVNNDLDRPDQLPRPTKNVTYDPYYVRIVFINSLTCYNMSIIVPSLVYDQFGNLARQGTNYANVLSKTDEITALGYMSSFYNASNNFDRLNFTFVLPGTSGPLAESQRYIFSNAPFSLPQNAVFSPSSLFANMTNLQPGEHGLTFPPPTPFNTSLLNFIVSPTPPVYFVCRRQNWNPNCHLMQATNPQGSSIYLAYGAGDIIPLKLDPVDAVPVDKRQLSHMYKFSHAITDRKYDSVKTISVANQPFVVAVTTQGGLPQFLNLSFDPTIGTGNLQVGPTSLMQFPTECYVVGMASTTLTSVIHVKDQLGRGVMNTGNFVKLDSGNRPVSPEFQLIPYNNLVYLIRAVSNVTALSSIGGLGLVSGLLIDTFVPAKSGFLELAQAARHQRSKLSYFGQSYTPTTMVDSLDTLDFASITGETFYAPTIFIPIAEIDDTKGLFANLSNFLGQQVWTFIYPEIVVQPNPTDPTTPYPKGYNIDIEGKPVLSLQKLHFAYDPLVVMFTPNDLVHKYRLQPKEQVLALTNGQILEGICWRSANLQPLQPPPTNLCAQQILPPDEHMDRPNIIYSPHNRPLVTSSATDYRGMSLRSILSISGVAYQVEEHALSGDQITSNHVSTVSSASNLLIAVLFDYDNDDHGTLRGATDPGSKTTRGVVFVNGYQSASGYTFSSPDHFDVNDVLPSHMPLLEQMTEVFGDNWDVSFYNEDLTLPRQFWSLAYDTFTVRGLPNYVSNVPPSIVDPTFNNRTRSLILSLENSVRPNQLGVMDTYNSIVSVNLHLANGVTGSVFVDKMADRDIIFLGSDKGRKTGLHGLPPNYQFIIFSRDHYGTLSGGTRSSGSPGGSSFDLVDHGYAMCVVDDGSGSGNKVAKYYIDSEGHYYELYSYALTTPIDGIVETSTFILKVALGTAGDLRASPVILDSPNSVNPQDLVKHINRVSRMVYAAFGPTIPGQPPAYIPIQAVGNTPEAAPILGQPGFSGYSINVVSASRQPFFISQLYSGSASYPIAGSTSIRPVDLVTGEPIPFYGSLSHGLDPMTRSSFVPRANSTVAASAIRLGGNGLGALARSAYSRAFQGSPAVPQATTAGSVMRADESVFYTYNAVANTVMDSAAATLTNPVPGQYFVDSTANLQSPIFCVITPPSFLLNGNNYTFNLSTTLPDGTSSRFSMIVGTKSYLLDPGNASVTVDRTKFTFNRINHGVYNVSYMAVDSPTASESPSSIPLTPFAMTGGGKTATIDIFNAPNSLQDISLGVQGRLYSYDPTRATIQISHSGTSTTVPLQPGLIYVSPTGYGYVIRHEDGKYNVNGSPTVPFTPSPSGDPLTYPLMTSPKMFVQGNNFYTFDQDQVGAYISVSGNGSVYPVNPYQFSISGRVYIINTNVQPNTVVGGGNVYVMTAGNTQFLLEGTQYTISLRQNSLSGALVSGQFNISQGNVVVLENYVYQLDTLNGQVVGNGTDYPLTTSGLTYTITTADRSFTVTSKSNATTITLMNAVYQITNTSVVGNGQTYPISRYRSFLDGATKYDVGLDGSVSIAPPLELSQDDFSGQYTFTDGVTYNVFNRAAFDGVSRYFLIIGDTPQFSPSAGLTYTLRNDGVAITAGEAKTYIVHRDDAVSSNQCKIGTQTLFFGRPGDMAAFDGIRYYAITNGEFTDTTTNRTFAINGNTAISEGNSYEIFSNLGQTPQFAVPGGPTYYVNILVATSNADSASGDIYNVFPLAGGQFTLLLPYKITVSTGSNLVNVASTTFASGTHVSTLHAVGGSLIGGFFIDPVTKISYTCSVQGSQITFTDSNSVKFPVATSPPNTPYTFVAQVVIYIGVSLAVDNQATNGVYPVINNQFSTDAFAYNVNASVAFQDAVNGPYWPITHRQFVIPRPDPLSDVIYTLNSENVTKGYVISNDDEFSADGNAIYTINMLNVVKSVRWTTLSGAEPLQKLTAGSLIYTLHSDKSLATNVPPGLFYDAAKSKFTVSYNGIALSYSIGAGLAFREDHHPFSLTTSGSQVTFTDSLSAVTFTFDRSGNNPIVVGYQYQNHYFVDVLNNISYFIDEADRVVQAISYLPETTQYGFTAPDGMNYFIHYDDVEVVFPVISGPDVNAGVTTVGSDIFTVHIDEVDPTDGSAGVPVNKNSFEINGNLYTIAGTPVGADYSSCIVFGPRLSPQNFISPTSFRLTDPSVVYTLQLDADKLPMSISAQFKVKASQNLLTVDNNVYILTYNSVSAGSLLGQGKAAIGITNSSFALTNYFDSTVARFYFADPNILDSASVVGQFTVNYAPTFFMPNATYTLDPGSLVITDNNKRSLPLITNPRMFSINGFNYVIDTNQTPHAVVGNNNTSPLSTDVTVESGHALPHSTFTLNGLIYKYVEDVAQNLLLITGTRNYLISQPMLTFRLDSSLLFTIAKSPPTAGNYPGSVVPLGVVSAGNSSLNLYAGVPQSGGLDFFIYQNTLYTLVQSNAVYVAVQKSYPVYVSQPVASQPQLAVFNLNGTTGIVTAGTTAGDVKPAGITPETIWAATSTSTTEVQFGQVYGFSAPPINVMRSASGGFQFQLADAAKSPVLYDIRYRAGSSANVVHIDVPGLLPAFWQDWQFPLGGSSPLVFETGGYNAFTTFVSEGGVATKSYSMSYRSALTSTDALISSLITAQGDFSIEFWHSEPTKRPEFTSVMAYSVTSHPLVQQIKIGFQDTLVNETEQLNVYMRVNDLVMKATTAPPMLSSGWRHLALTYAQPYAMTFTGAGFEVKKADNYNLNREFSLMMVFMMKDVTKRQGLLYKGTGSHGASPDLRMSYMVTVEGGKAYLTFTDGNLDVSNPFQSQATIIAGRWYELTVTKQTLMPGASSDDPYQAPVGPADYNTMLSSKTNLNISGLQLGSDSTVTMSKFQPPSSDYATTFVKQMTKNGTAQNYQVSMVLRAVNANGQPGEAVKGVVSSGERSTSNDGGLQISSTGSAHLLIGSAFDARGYEFPLGSAQSPGYIKRVSIFNSAVSDQGIRSTSGYVPLAYATAEELARACIVGSWTAQYDANGVVANSVDSTAVAISTKPDSATLSPLPGHEFEGMSLYLNGNAMMLTISGSPPSEMLPDVHDTFLELNAGQYKLSEISIWQMCRQPAQILDDMFGRIVTTNEPLLALYLAGSYPPGQELGNGVLPPLPLNRLVDSIPVTNPITSLKLTFPSVSLHLSGCPALGRCGPLITPNLYTPPTVALTVCDAVPDLTTYSTTATAATGSLAGTINEAYVYIKDQAIMLYVGKKVGDLVLTWVSQEQGSVQVVGYIEGAPPCPMANLTNRAAYAGATSVTLSTPASVSVKYDKVHDTLAEAKLFLDMGVMGAEAKINLNCSPCGVGCHNEAVKSSLSGTANWTYIRDELDNDQSAASAKVDEVQRYTARMEGSQTAVTDDNFMASLNTLTMANDTAGGPSSRTAILADPQLGGFTRSNPPAPLPRSAPAEERFGSRMYRPSPYGQAFVTSQTLDVYQQKLLQTNTVYGYVRLPNTQIPRDINVVAFRMSSKYVRPGCLDGVVTYAYKPATLPTGRDTYMTSTGEMQVQYDGNFSTGTVGHDASYMRIVEAYKLKKQIDQQSMNAVALYHSLYDARGNPNDSRLMPALDFYNEYVWSAQGGTQEVKHTYSTSYNEVYSTGHSDAISQVMRYSGNLVLATAVLRDIKFDIDETSKDTVRYSYNTTGTSSFDMAASFDGIDADTQMRYASANDAHFIMKNNSMFNANNQGGLNLVAGSDGLVYNIVPSVSSGAGVPLSDNIDDSDTYSQPSPAYSSGNANGLTGSLEPYHRPGKTKAFRTYAFFLQPSANNASAFWDTVVDPVWLANSPESDAVALRTADRGASIPWRLMYRVTYSERYLPPVSSDPVQVPQITPLMAVPVQDAATDFLFTSPSATSHARLNPHNDIEANVTLVVPTVAGLSVGTIQTSGTGIGTPALANNVIPFHLVQDAESVASWGDSANQRLLGALASSALGLNTLTMVSTLVPGSTKLYDIIDPVRGSSLYSVYRDPNGLLFNFCTIAGITVFQDVNANPIQYFDGKMYHSLQADYIASGDGSAMYYIQPPSTYDQTAWDLVGDYDLFGRPGDQWRYYLVSGTSAVMTSVASVTGGRPFSGAGATYTGFTVPRRAHDADTGARLVQGYVLVQGLLQWPHLNSDAETLADVLIYKAMSLLDSFPLGDLEVLVAFLGTQYPGAPFLPSRTKDTAYGESADIPFVFARNIMSYFNAAQQTLLGR